MIIRNLRADEIDVRVGMQREDGLSLLLYKDARVDMDILDETFGIFGWKREHSRDNANCTVSVWDEAKGQWITKEDTGTESNTEKEKGLASDSFKRACVNLGIGRELYTAPLIWIERDLYELDKNGRLKTRFRVSEIETTEQKKIVRLVIVKKRGEVVFDWTDPGAKKQIHAPVFQAATPKSEASAEPAAPPAAPHEPLTGFATPKQVQILSSVYDGPNLMKLLKTRDLGSLDDMTAEDAYQLIEKLKKAGKVA